MSILNNSLLLGADAGAAGYQISRSLRFNSSDSAYLSRTPASAGNRTTWTWAGWVKRSAFGNNYTLFSSTTDSYDLSYNQIQFEAGNKIRLKFADGGTTTLDLTTNAVFRDASAWYHILIAVDTTQSAQQSRVSIYINGALQALTGTYPGQNANTIFNKAFASHHLAGSPPISEYFSGYLADIYFIDGQALTPSSFAETNATTGQWVPKAYSGTYGTNGFQLKFADNSAATATTLGKDTSGNSNNWTPNNLSVTAGAGNDSLVDTPTSYGTDTGAGGEVRGNYCILNALDNGGLTLSNGNLDNTQTNVSAYRMAKGTIGMSSGKWYWETTITNRSATFESRFGIGISAASEPNTGYVGETANGYSFFTDANNASNSFKVNSGSFTNYGSGYGTNDVLMFAFDATDGKLWFGKNGTWISSGNPATAANPSFSSIPANTYFPAISTFSSSSATSSAVSNFGQRPFAYTAPSGFKALCDQNLPAPTIAKGSSAFDVKLYTGTGSTQTISGLGFSPDLVWIKKRSGSEWHCINDTVRGAELYLSSNTTNAESGANNVLTAFTSTGYTVGSQGIVNDNGFTFASWCWDAGSSTATNTQGSITSQVRANASAGFSIVSATAPSSYASFSFGHGLGVKPAMVIYKERTGTASWWVWHQGLPNAATGRALNLNSTSGEVNGTYWGTINSSIVTSNYTQTTLSAPFVAYCFAPVAGYSSFGSYTANNSADGPFIYTGFRPTFILFKASSRTSDWSILDAARNRYNVSDATLSPNLSNAEVTGTSTSYAYADFLSNGFKIRGNSSAINDLTNTYIYAAFAENPFQYARAR